MTKKDGIEELLASIRKSHGENSIMRLGGPVEPVAVIPSGCLSLDVAMGIGGYPRGRIVEVFGNEASGKTTLSLHAIAEIQKQGGTAAFIDAEHALDLKYAGALGVDVGKLLLSQPDNGEQALNIVEDLVDSTMIDLIVVDSVAALTPKSEIDGDMGAHHVGVHARLMSQALRKLAGTASKSATTILFINQQRQKIGVLYGSPVTTTGGVALKFYASIRIDVSKKEQVKDGEGDATGNRTVCKVVKNKLAPPFREADVEIRWGSGIDRASDVLGCAVSRGLVEKSGSWFSYAGERLGQGFNTVAEHLRAHPKLFEAIEGRLRKELLP